MTGEDVASELDPVAYGKERFRNGEAGRRLRGNVLCGARLIIGEMLRSELRGVSSSS